MMLETVDSSETSVNFYKTTRRNIPEHTHLQNGFRKRMVPLSELSLCIKTQQRQLCARVWGGGGGGGVLFWY
jgi:hypothetical protein